MKHPVFQQTNIWKYNVMRLVWTGERPFFKVSFSKGSVEMCWLGVHRHLGGVHFFKKKYCCCFLFTLFPFFSQYCADWVCTVILEVRLWNIFWLPSDHFGGVRRFYLLYFIFSLNISNLQIFGIQAWHGAETFISSQLPAPPQVKMVKMKTMMKTMRMIRNNVLKVTWFNIAQWHSS